MKFNCITFLIAVSVGETLNIDIYNIATIGNTKCGIYLDFFACHLHAALPQRYKQMVYFKKKCCPQALPFLHHFILIHDLNTYSLKEGSVMTSMPFRKYL